MLLSETSYSHLYSLILPFDADEEDADNVTVSSAFGADGSKVKLASGGDAALAGTGMKAAIPLVTISAAKIVAVNGRLCVEDIIDKAEEPTEVLTDQDERDSDSEEAFPPRPTWLVLFVQVPRHESENGEDEPYVVHHDVHTLEFGERTRDVTLDVE
ncbi:hypothetical protein [Haloarcula sp. K1]|uniref:hypothetical protein n=1 Tax=Haloarcula sp. K1 TaxID=1622207 RepID=UPI001E553584|nr:hypothetical protein [Haloarcula sp. K1]